jgi:transcriptional regulator with XRE-family HTH domain
MSGMDIKARFGRAVRARRAALGISQEELALRIGADQAYVSRIEAGRMNVTLETAQAIAAALEADVTALLAAPGEAAQ